MVDAFGFNQPDKIPVIYTPSPAGLYVHGQKLIDLYREFPPDNPIDLELLAVPVPPPGTVNAGGKYHEIKTDEWGTEWECLIYGVTGHPRRYPFESWAEAADYSFPATAVPAPETVRAQQVNHLVFWGWISIFEKLQALRPIDEVLMDVVSGDRGLLAFMDRLVAHWEKAIRLALDAGVDVIVFADDWGTQTSTIISPALFREIFKPRYQKMMEPIRKAGRRVFFHSCGQLGGIFDELLDLGINGLWPQIRLHEAAPGAVDKCRERKVAIYIHPDRQRLVPLGTPREIEDEIQRYCGQYREQGGGAIFHVEMENDAPFKNIEALVKSVHRHR